MRHLNMDLIRATEAAAIAASKWVGSGEKEQADKAATDAMRSRLNGMDFRARIIIGEGKKDESFGLYDGEEVGSLREQSLQDIFEIAVDPIDGTRPTVNSGPGALSVMALANEGAMFATQAFYMNKLAYGPKTFARARLSLNDTPKEMVAKVCKALSKEPHQVMVCILDRPRHEELVKQFRALGVRIKLIRDCDITGAIAACLPRSGVDIQIGVGGAPEAVITACAIKSLGGNFECQMATDEGVVEDKKIYTIQDLVKGDCIFVATGITDGSLLRGVRYSGSKPVTSSVFMRSESGSIRWITAIHGND